jgi:hypothetical protein
VRSKPPEGSLALWQPRQCRTNRGATSRSKASISTAAADETDSAKINSQAEVRKRRPRAIVALVVDSYSVTINRRSTGCQSKPPVVLLLRLERGPDRAESKHRLRSFPTRIALEFNLKPGAVDVEWGKAGRSVGRHAVNPVELHPREAVPPPVQRKSRFVDFAGIWRRR